MVPEEINKISRVLDKSPRQVQKEDGFSSRQKECLQSAEFCGTSATPGEFHRTNYIPYKVTLTQRASQLTSAPNYNFKSRVLNGVFQ